MQITSVRGGEERMTFCIVQEQQRSAAQNLAGESDQAARDQMIGVHRLLVSIEVEGWWGLAWRLRFLPPALLPPATIVQPPSQRSSALWRCGMLADP